MPVSNLLIKGEKHIAVASAVPTDSLLQPEASYSVGAATRGAASEHEVKLDNTRMVEFIFDDGTTWLCGPDALEDVFPGATQPTRAINGSTAFEIPQTLRGETTERGFSDIVLKVVNVFTKQALGDKVNEVVRNFAQDLEKKQLENQSGLYRIDDRFTLQKFEAGAVEKPYLLFLHGTNSSTKGSFAELAQQRHDANSVWAGLKQLYGANTIAFQHETLTKSPLRNVLELVQQLPDTAILHLVSHSRGGLVGDVLSRFCNSNESTEERGFDKNERQYLTETKREDDIKCINAIQEALKNKRIIVEKFIRVACPAAGTILASKRLDNFLNVSLNLLGLGVGIAASPVYLAFKNLIAAAADSKNSLDALPGIEAMNPDSPFIKVLNSPGTTIQIDNPLVVISGNCKASLNLKALLIIASKLFYFTNNDLVVNTLSMYQGSKRGKNLTYLFDEATDVDHFHYFANEKTSAALMAALRSDGDLVNAGFKSQEQQQLALYGRNILLNLEGGKLFNQTVTGKKPIVVLLPGIMGSNLSDAQGNDIWINYWRFLTGDLDKLKLAANDGIKAKSIVATSYKKLYDYLSPMYDVFTFPYDWRQSLTQSAARFNDEIVALLKYAQPIKIIGHSMGGVLVRDFIINHPQTWKQLNASKEFRLIFLGAPLGGSFRIPAVLFGQDSIINMLSKIDIKHTKKQLLDYFSQMPGLWSLLPLTEDAANDFVSETVWKNMAGVMEAGWPLPAMKSNGVNNFETYRKTALQGSKDIDYTNTVYIAGKDKATPCGYRIDTLADKSRELVFLSTAEGDQSVTWESGIPKKLIENKAVYYVNVSHGALAADRSIFDGIADILKNGYTALLSKTRPSVRSEEKVFRAPLPQDFDLSEAGVSRGLLGLGDEEAKKPATVIKRTPVVTSVRNGDLRYASFPVLAGHFAGDGILYAERQIDETLDKALSIRHRLGIYPGPIGTNTVILPGGDRRKGAIIVGLDSFGALTSFQLIQTVEQGVAKYLLEANSRCVCEKEAPQTVMGISTVLIGSGYGGLSIENSVRAIVQGIQNANSKIDSVNSGRMKLIEQIEFVELYEDRALSCFYAVSKLERSGEGALNVSLDKSGLKTLFGAQKRIPAEISEGWWQRIHVRLNEDKKSATGDGKKESDEKEEEVRVRCLEFSLSTGGAREEKRNVYISPVGLDKMINDSSDGKQWSPELAKTLFELLVPLDFKEQLKKQCNINWIVDKFTAGYPWELLQDKVAEAKPLSIIGAMIRQLATEQYRLRINAVTADSALVIGDPDLQGFVTQLPGAKEEGEMVSELLQQHEFATTPLIRRNSTEIIKALYSTDYKIIHLAGHGLFDAKDPLRSGMAIGKKEFLSTFHISQMSTVPELVFVNCCYLGKMESIAEEYYSNRYKLAANIGTQLIENGVRAVVVAGWEVDDAAALEFTRLFYSYMFANYNFGTAIQEARRTIYEKYGHANNTWGAYQAYGDPFYKFRDNVMQKKEYKPSFAIAEEAEMELYNLRNDLKTPKYSQREQLERLEAISKAVDEAVLRQASITELEALIYADMYAYDQAIKKFADLLAEEKASFSVSTLEKYCNVRMKKYVYQFLKDGVRSTDPAQNINRVIKDLDYLLLVGETAERFNLLGSAYKRKAIMGKDAGKQSAYTMSACYYRTAHATKGASNPAWALTNWYEMESVLMRVHAGRQWDGEIRNGKETYTLPCQAEAVKNLNRIIDDFNTTGRDMDYWYLMQKPNVNRCLLIVTASPDNKNDKDWRDLLEMYRDVWNNAGTRGDKLAEVEQMDILLDVLKPAKKGAADDLVERLTALKEGLMKML